MLNQSFFLFLGLLLLAGCNSTESNNNTPMTTNAAQVVQQQLDAYNKRDIDAFMTLFSDNATLLSFPGDQVLAQGKAKVKEVYQKLFESSPKLHSELIHRSVIGNRVIDHERISGRLGNDVVELVVVYEVTKGKISRCMVIK